MTGLPGRFGRSAPERRTPKRRYDDPDSTARRVCVASHGTCGHEPNQMRIDMSADTPADTLKVLLFSDDSTTRKQVRLALGRRIAPDLPELEIFDTATQPAVFHAVESSHYDVVILDGEAQPAGGFGIAYQLKEEVSNCPPVVLLVARKDDAWLATWSRAEGISSYPIDPLRLPRTVAEVVRATR